MIAKIGRGSSFRGALNYLLQKEHQPEIVGGNMAGTTPRELAREFGASRQLRTQVEQPVEHVSFSWSPHEQVSPDQMRAAVERWLEQMGFDRAANQYTVVRHKDRDHPHCHVLISRIRTDNGRLVAQPWREYVRNKEVCRSIEKEMGFERLPSRSRSEGHECHPTRGEERMAIDRGLASEKEQIKYLLREAASGEPTMTDFLNRVRAQGIQVRPNVGRNGRVSGISFRLDQVAVKGSQLGRSFTWQGLQRSLGVQYDRGRDAAAVADAHQATLGRDVIPRKRGGRLRVPAMNPKDLVPALARSAARAVAKKIVPAPLQPALSAVQAFSLAKALVISPAPVLARVVASAVLDKVLAHDPPIERPIELPRPSRSED